MTNEGLHPETGAAVMLPASGTLTNGMANEQAGDRRLAVLRPMSTHEACVLIAELTVTLSATRARNLELEGDRAGYRAVLLAALAYASDLARQLHRARETSAALRDRVQPSRLGSSRREPAK